MNNGAGIKGKAYKEKTLYFGMEIKTQPLSSRTTPGEMQLIEGGARHLGLTVSGFVRMTALVEARNILKENSEANSS